MAQPTMTDNRRCRDCNVRYTPTTSRHKRCPRCQSKVPMKSCQQCHSQFSPLHGSQRKCEPCRDGKSDALRNQARLGKPGYEQCPYRYCLDVYATKTGHKCGSGRKPRTDRLALIDAEPELVVLAGPPVSANAIGVHNSPETLDEAIQWDRHNGYAKDHKNTERTDAA